MAAIARTRIPITASEEANEPEPVVIDPEAKLTEAMAQVRICLSRGEATERTVLRRSYLDTQQVVDGAEAAKIRKQVKPRKRAASGHLVTKVLSHGISTPLQFMQAINKAYLEPIVDFAQFDPNERAHSHIGLVLWWLRVADKSQAPLPKGHKLFGEKTVRIAYESVFAKPTAEWKGAESSTEMDGDANEIKALQAITLYSLDRLRACANEISQKATKEIADVPHVWSELNTAHQRYMSKKMTRDEFEIFANEKMIIAEQVDVQRVYGDEIARLDRMVQDKQIRCIVRQKYVKQVTNKFRLQLGKLYVARQWLLQDSDASKSSF